MGNANSHDEIQSYIDKDATIIDVRTSVEHAVYNHPRSVNIPLSTLQTTDQLPADPNQPIIVHCLSGHRSQNAIEILHDRGYKNVINGGSVMNIMNYK
jgi:phage shock protein E